jgi:hypothetical protein
VVANSEICHQKHNVVDHHNPNIMAQDIKKFHSGKPIICQLLSLIPDSVFQDAIEETGSDHYYKQMMSKDHFVCLFYAVLTRNGSLREVCKNIMMLGKKLMYYGLRQIPCKSTLSDANRNRDSLFFATLYMNLHMHYKSYILDHSFSLPIGGEVDASKVEVFDSTTVTLFKEILKGAGRKTKGSKKKKGGIKAFTKMNLLENVPNFVCFKAAACNENSFLQSVELEEGSIAVFDKGFNKYWYFSELGENGVGFVTRQKDNAKYTVLSANDISDESDIISDQVIALKYKHLKVSRTVTLRLVIYKDPVSGEILRFLTNLMELKPMTISLLYKNRWAIEVLFKQIKQNFEVKYFLSDTENGIKSQIWVALILNLLFTVLHKIIKGAEDFSTMVALAAKNLCSYVNLVMFLKMPQSYCNALYKKEIRNIQLDLFRNSGGG